MCLRRTGEGQTYLGCRLKQTGVHQQAEVNKFLELRTS